MGRSKIRLELRIDTTTSIAIESEMHRLHQDLLRLKKEGKKPTCVNITGKDVTRLAILLGLEAMRQLTFEQFEAECKRRQINA
jgi:hypothetical protein